MHRVLTNDATASGVSRPTRSERASWLTYEPVDEDEEEGEEDEARVPHPDAPVDGGDAEEEEDDGLRAVGQHLHGVLDGRHWRLVHVGLDVALAGDAREHDAERRKQINKQTNTRSCFHTVVMLFGYWSTWKTIQNSTKKHISHKLMCSYCYDIVMAEHNPKLNKQTHK